MIAFLLVVVVIIAVGVGALVYRSRPQNSIESGIHSFRREMRALAPPPEHRRGPHDGPGAPSDPQSRDVE